LARGKDSDRGEVSRTKKALASVRIQIRVVDTTACVHENRRHSDHSDCGYHYHGTTKPKPAVLFRFVVANAGVETAFDIVVVVVGVGVGV